MTETVTDHTCAACGGKIVKVTDSKFSDDMRPAMIGPGSKSQYRETVSYHCGDCGIMYRFLPKR